MYLQDAVKTLGRRPGQFGAMREAFGGPVGRNVLILGLTSMFTDISSEMVLAVIPLYLTQSVGLSVVGFGLFEGAYQTASASFRLVGGSLADQKANHKTVAATGYGISALTRLGLFLTTFWAGALTVPLLLIDRVGKGLRVAPRDALISLSVKKANLGVAFGAHRMLDTLGALLGPVVAYFLLSLTPGAFDTVFLVATTAGFAGLTIIVLLAKQPALVTSSTIEHRARPNLKLRKVIREALAISNVRLLALVVAMLSLGTVSDSFLYLFVLKNSTMDVALFPLLFSGTAITYLMLAMPVGRLADRLDRRNVFLAGNCFLALSYVVLANQPINAATVAFALGSLGVYYAATDGVVAALASGLVGKKIRGTTLGLISMTAALAKLCSAILFGVLWQYFGASTALNLFASLLSVSMVAALVLLAKLPKTDV